MPLDSRKKPECKDSQEAENSLEKIWRSALSTMEQADTYYFQTNNIWDLWEAKHPKSRGVRPNHHTGAGPALVNQAVDSHLAFFPRFHREPSSDSEKAKKTADNLEKALQAVIDDAFRSNMNFPPKLNGKQLVRHNYTTLFTTLDTEYLRRPKKKIGEDKEDFEFREWEWRAKRFTWNPIRFEVPGPGEMLIDPMTKHPKFAVRRRTVLAMDLHEMSLHKIERNSEGKPFDMAKHDPYDKLEIREFWYPRWIQVMLGGEELWVEPNDYWFVPVTHTFGGSADTPAGKDFDPDDWVKQSMLYYEIPNIRMEAQSFQGHHGLLMRAAWAKTGVSSDAAAAAQNASGDDMLQGEKSDYWIEEIPNLPGASFEHLRMVQRQLETTSYSKIAAGQRQGEAETATGMIILSENTNRTFRAVRTQMEYLYSIAASYVLRLLDRMNQILPPEDYSSIEINEATLNVKDIEDRYYVRASFEQIDAVAAEREIAQASDLLARKLIDKKRFYQIARMENVSDIEEGLLEDEVDALPPVHAAMLDLALQERGLGKIARQMEQAAQQEQTAQQGQLLGPNGQPIPRTGGAGPVAQ
jgi:hypothetical protein